jgi:hypothetical protein
VLDSELVAAQHPLQPTTDSFGQPIVSRPAVPKVADVQTPWRASKSTPDAMVRGA